MNLPKNILRVRDLTFILPDDFNGTFEDAFEEFIRYRKINIDKAKKIVDSGDISSIEMLLASHSDEMRACGEYGIFQLIDGKYVSILDTGSKHN